MSSYTELEERLSRLEDEVEDLKRHQRPPRRTFAGIELTDNDELVRLFMDLGCELGFDVTVQPVPIEELHKQMLAEGVRPEDCLISSGIREMRGEADD